MLSHQKYKRSYLSWGGEIFRVLDDIKEVKEDALDEVRAFKGKLYAVFGAAGFIGSAVASELLNQGAEVVAVVKNGSQGDSFWDRVQEPRSTEDQQRCNIDYVDVTNPKHLGDFVQYHSRQMFDGLVYSVGHCPPGGFEEANETPLLRLTKSQLFNEMRLHCAGLIQMINATHTLLKEGARIAVAGSAINQYDPVKLPDFLHPEAYAAAKSAQENLCRFYNRELSCRNIRVEYVALPAVDTPFHTRRPPEMISVSEAANRLLQALKA